MNQNKWTSNFRWWPFWVSLAFLSLTTFILFYASLKHTNGTLVYPLDDAYMHLTMARNLAEHGVFGFSPEHVMLASSSPLYTFIVAVLFRTTGIHAGVPILINLFFGLLILGFSFLHLERQNVSLQLITIFLLAIVIFVPLPLIILTGMEHTLQTFLVLLFLRCLGELWRTGPIPKVSYLTIGMIAALCTATRYESLFLISASCALLLLRRRFGATMAIGLGAAVGIGVPGLYSVLHGGHFIPISILLKKNTPEAFSPSGLLYFVHTGLKTMSAQTYAMVLMLVLLVLCCFAQRAAGTFWNRHTASGVVWIAACYLHVQFARFGWVFRYEAYLIASGFFLITASLANIYDRERNSIRKFFGRSSWLLAYPIALTAMLSAPFITRGLGAWNIYVGATRNIYDQQFQMSRFVRQYYPRSRVVLNDIGAVSFYTRASIFDIFGLATPEVATAKLANRFDGARLGELTRGAGSEIAIAYAHWLLQVPGGLPAYWKPVGTWTITNNVICGSDTVTFYAIDPFAEPLLRRNLIAFKAELPLSVKQTIAD